MRKGTIEPRSGRVAGIGGALLWGLPVIGALLLWLLPEITVAATTGTGVDLGGGPDDTDVHGASIVLGGDNQVHGIGLDAGVGPDQVTNTGRVLGDLTASGVRDYSLLSPDLIDLIFGPFQVEAVGVGFFGNNGVDLLINDFSIDMQVDASGIVSSFGTNPLFQDPLTITAGVLAHGTAMDGGTGADELRNRGSALVTAGAGLDRVDFAVNVLDSSIVDAFMSADAVAAGLDGGFAEDLLVNESTGLIDVHAATQTRSSMVEVNFIDILGGVVATRSNALAVGMDGDTQVDTLSNLGRIQSEALASSESTSMNLTFADFTIMNGPARALADAIYGNEPGLATSRTVATSIGMDGGADGTGVGDTLTNAGAIVLNAESSTSSTSIGVAMAGVPASVLDLSLDDTLADAGSDALAAAVGMRGGEDADAATVDGHDTLHNTGTIDGSARGTAQQTGVALSLPAPETLTLPILSNVGFTLGAATAGADAWSAGLEGGAGSDVLRNDGHVHMTAEADAGAVSVAVELPDASSNDATSTDISLTVADASTLVNALSLGMTGGAVDPAAVADQGDLLINGAGGTLEARADADAHATSVGVTIGLGQSSTSAAQFVAEGVAARTVVDAAARAVGMQGDEGDDVMLNEGAIVSDAVATASGTGVAVGLDGVTRGGVVSVGLADNRISAGAEARGFEGGPGADSLDNRGSVDVHAHSDADSDTVSVNVAVAAQTGFSGSGALARHDVSSRASAIGVDWPAGDLSVVNSGAVSADAEAEAHSSAVNVAAAVTGQSGASLGVSLADGATRAEAEARAVDSSEAADVLVNDQGLRSRARADAGASGVGVTGSFTQVGVAAGVAGVRTGASGLADAVTVRTGGGADQIINAADLSADAVATTAAAGVSTALTVNQTGAAIGGALAESTGVADASAVALDAGLGDDSVINSAAVAADALAESQATGVSIQLAGTMNGVGAGVAAARSDSQARSAATAISTGGASEAAESDVDSVWNLANVAASAVARLVSDAVSVALNGSLTGGLGFSWTDADGEAAADARGIVTGADGDMVVNDGAVTVTANGDASATGVSVDVAAAVSTGAAVGVALADTATNASAAGRGIDLGGGTDQGVNHGTVEVDASSRAAASGVSVSLAGAVSGGLGAGGSLVDASTIADADALGVDGGDGADHLANEGTVRATADAVASSDSVAVGVSGTGTGVALNAAVTRAETVSDARALGLAGGDGDDTLLNEGLVVAGSTADSDADSVAVTGGFAGAGLSGGAALADAGTRSHATSSGLDGGTGLDAITNAGHVDADAAAFADSTSVAVSVQGVVEGVALGFSYADADTEASARAMGTGAVDEDWSVPLALPGDGDTVRNVGLIEVDALAETHIAGVSVNAPIAFVPGGAAIVRARSHSAADALGLGGSRGEDVLENVDTVAVLATARSGGPAVAVNVLGGTVGNVDAEATAGAWGMRGGAADDMLANAGALDVAAGADARGSLVEVTLVGGAVGAVGVEARADATAMAGDAGDDMLVSSGELATRATADTPASNVNVNLLGAAIGDAATQTLASAVSLSGGDGDDVLANQGTLASDAAGTSGGAGVSVTLAGDADAAANNRVSTSAAGLDGGAGADTLSNTGTLQTRAAADADTDAVSVNLIGAALVDATTRAEASAVAMSGGDAADVLDNAAAVDVQASAVAGAGGTGVVVGGATVTDVSVSGAAESVGLAGDAGADVVFNSGTVSSLANAAATARTLNLTGLGLAASDGASAARAAATGLAGGDGDDLLGNTGLVSVEAGTVLDAASVDVAIGGAAIGDFGVASTSTATGIHGGAGVDDIDNAGIVNVQSSAAIHAAGTAVSIAGLAGTGGTTSARAVGRGIAGGSTVDNSGTVTGSAHAELTQSNVAVGILGVAASDSDLLADATFTGIGSSTGNDSVSSSGVLDVAAEAVSAASGSSFALVGAASTRPTLGADARSYGVVTDAGDDRVDLAGTTAVHALADASFSGGATSIAGFAGSTPGAGAASTAGGVLGGAGADEISAAGQLTVVANATTGLSGSSFSLLGAAVSGGFMSAAGDAIGLTGEGGDDVVVSEADASVAARARTTVTGGANVAIGAATSESLAGAGASATGISGGAGDDWLGNLERLVVDVASDVFGRSSGFAFIGGSSSDAAFQARSESRGLDGGQGDDTLQNVGELMAGALAETDSEGSTTAIIGGSASHAALGVAASAAAMDGGAGNDLLDNRGAATATAAMNARSVNRTYTGGLFSSGLASSRLLADLSATGAGAGEGNNSLHNAGAIGAAASGGLFSRVEATGSYVSLDVDANATAEGVAIAPTARGLSAGSGADVAVNAGSIQASVLPAITASALADGNGIADADGTARAEAHARNAAALGVTLGDGPNVVINDGTIAVTSAPVVSAATSSDADGIPVPSFDFPSVADLTGQIIDAAVDGDLGAVLSALRGGIRQTVEAVTPQQASSRSTATARADGALALGVVTGTANDQVDNAGTISVTAAPRADRARALAARGGDIFGIDATATAVASASGAQALAISTGGGDDLITNRGVIDAGATPFAEASAEAQAVGFGGDARASATARADNALAVGIDGGAGADRILNHGTITAVSAPAVATAATANTSGNCFGPRFDVDPPGADNTFTVNLQACSGVEAPTRTSSTANALAYGVRAGSGDDLVVNDGSIVATVAGSAGAGIAIDTGPGNDWVALTDGSFTNGRVLLGSGDDTLALTGTPVTPQPISADSGADTLLLDGPGSFDGSLSNFEQAVKQGLGIFTVNALPMLQAIEISGGTLGVTSDLVLANDGTLHTFVAGDGSFGALTTTGTAALGGTLAVADGGGVFVDGTSYDVVAAAALDGAFSAELLPAPTVLLSFASDRLPTSQRITANVASFTTLAEDDAERSFALALDDELASAEGEMADMLATLQRLDDETVLRSMFDGLSPDAYATFSATTLDSATQVMSTTQQWMAGLRADAGDDLTDAFASAPTSAGRMWGVSFNGADAVAPLNESSLTFDHGLRGFAYGVDLLSGSDATLGFSVASTAARQGAADGAQSGMLRSEQFSLYGSRLLGQRGYVDAVLSYGDTRHDTARLLTTRTGGRGALARYDGSVRSFLTEAGYRLDAPGRTELYGSFTYTAEHIDAFSESGAGGLGLVFADRSHVRLDSELGIRWGTELASRWGVLEPRASIGWIRREQLGQRTYRARFAGTDHWFRLHDGQTDDHGVRLAGSLRLGSRLGMSLSAGLAAELWRNDASGLLEVRATFR